MEVQNQSRLDMQLIKMVHPLAPLTVDLQAHGVAQQLLQRGCAFWLCGQACMVIASFKPEPHTQQISMREQGVALEVWLVSA